MNEENKKDENYSSEHAPIEDIPSLSSPGPLSSSARVAILAALFAIKRTTFTELMLVVNLPKSSLNLSLSILKENKLVTVKKGFVQIGGPRTIIEITPEGEKTIRDHLLMMQNVASKLLRERGKSDS